MMRSIRISPALAAAAAMLALAPASASAARTGHIGRGGCRVVAFAEPRVITSGEAVQVFGQVVCPPGGATSAAGQTVTVFERTGGSAFKSIATLTTNSAGLFATIPPSVTSDSVFYVRAAGKRSSNRAVKVAPQVTLSGPPDGAQLTTGKANRVTFSGAVTPADAGAEVLLQRESSISFEEWGTIQTGVVGPGNTFTITHTFALPGDANLRVVVRPHGKFTVRGISNTLSYEISQRQNPKLTIHSSADPVQFGKPLTISGVVAGGANEQVTLMSRPRGNHPLAPLMTTKTDSGGAYTFVIPSALASSVYRVTNGMINSAQLFQGVKYAVTAGVSATTVQAGQPLTFSGTVTPAHVGKVVYLERENGFGGGFHVVDLSTVGAGGLYSITHFVFGAGKQVYRIKVPGDPENQGASSQPFTIEVTPGVPPLVKPFKQGQLPGGGH